MVLPVQRLVGNLENLGEQETGGNGIILEFFTTRRYARQIQG